MCEATGGIALSLGLCVCVCVDVCVPVCVRVRATRTWGFLIDPPKEEGTGLPVLSDVQHYTQIYV